MLYPWQDSREGRAVTPTMGVPQRLCRHCTTCWDHCPWHPLAWKWNALKVYLALLATNLFPMTCVISLNLALILKFNFFLGCCVIQKLSKPFAKIMPPESVVMTAGHQTCPKPLIGRKGCYPVMLQGCYQDQKEFKTISVGWRHPLL